MSAPGRVVHAAVTADPIDVAALLAAVADPAAGGHAIFLGTVRDLDAGRTVTALDYEAHPTAALRIAEVARRHAGDGVVAIAVAHRTGHLEIGEVAVLVAVSAAHRAAAFATSRALIDEIKAEVPIWKRQVFADGGHGWV